MWSCKTEVFKVIAFIATMYQGVKLKSNPPEQLYIYIYLNILDRGVFFDDLSLNLKETSNQRPTYIYI